MLLYTDPKYQFYARFRKSNISADPPLNEYPLGKAECEFPCFDQTFFFDLNFAVGERIMIIISLTVNGLERSDLCDS